MGYLLQSKDAAEAKMLNECLFSLNKIVNNVVNHRLYATAKQGSRNACIMALILIYIL